MKLLRFRLLILPLLVLPLLAPSAYADMLGSDLSTFAVLGGTPDVTNTGATTITGNLGVFPAASLTGLSTITINGVNASTAAGSVFLHAGDATAGSAQSELATAISTLAGKGPGTTESSADLSGLTLSPGVYTVPAGTSNLTGTLTLDGGNDPNALWIFEFPSSLITSSGSSVKMINVGNGSGVGLYWDVGSFASLGTTTTFLGNIVASTNITLDTGATIGCGRALANSGEVTMDHNTVSIGCLGALGQGLGRSGGLNGGGGVTRVPEPGTLLLLGFGITGLAARMRRAPTRARSAKIHC